MKALIIYLTNGSEPSHSEAVQTAFVSGGGVNSDLYNISGFNQTVVNYAKDNGYDAIIFSYSGEESYFSLAESNPDIMIFMPSDNYNGDLQQLVLTDLLPTTDDAEFTDNTQTAQSFSNGYICGQLFYIASQRNCTLQEARICANETKDEDGIIDVDSAIAYTGLTVLNVGSLTAVRGIDKALTITLERIIDATGYKIEVRKLRSNYQEIIETTDLVNAYTLTSYGHFKFRYMGYNGSLESAWSSWQEIKYNSFNVIVS